MNEDWTAVGQAIAYRLDERGMTMTELAASSEVSLTIVRELVHVLNVRRRNPRTLARLSKALGWPEDHLLRVSRGEASDESEANPGELEALRTEVRELRQRVESLEDRVLGQDLP